MITENSAKLAVLIDADNASANIIDVLLEEIAKYGIASVKRIYGDWSCGLTKWKDALLPHAITPVQQFAYTKGKNATDMAMVIDAMDLLYSNTFDGFCIVSSDSDFTRLASRIRENGLTVYGFGQKKTPESFRKACDKFIYTENLMQRIPEESEDKENIQTIEKNVPSRIRKTPQELKQDCSLIDLIRNAVKEHADDEGWASLSVVGQYINKVNSDFDPRNYGYAKLSGLIRAIDLFETQMRGNRFSLRTRKRPAHHLTTPTADNKNTEPPLTIVIAAPGEPTQPLAANTKPPRPAANNNKPAPKITAMQGNTATGHGFSRLIPLIQNAIDATADDQGWASLSSVSKQLAQANPAFSIRTFGFADLKSAIAAIYTEWLESKKVGRGERVRVNKRYSNTGDN